MPSLVRAQPSNMKFLSHITSKSRSKADTDNDNNRTSRTAYEGSARHEHESRVAKARIDFRCNPTASYSQALLRMLLCYVCPHSQDDTFVPCEESMTDAGCMLCDVRDLSLCALVNKQWSEAATNVLSAYPMPSDQSIFSLTLAYLDTIMCE